MSKTVQMMDAGTALLVSGEEFGTVLGMVRTAMEEYGKVYRAVDGFNPKVPLTPIPYDLLLDFSTPWRYRFIAASVSDAGIIGGQKSYAVVFNEGDRSTVLRAACHLVPALMLLCLLLLGNVFISVGAIAAALVVIYLWIVPSSKAVNTVKALISKLSRI